MMRLSRPLILASSSPRRQFLLKEIGYSFKIVLPEGDESFSPTMDVIQVPQYLARKKAAGFEGKLNNQIIITADTVVILGKAILNKPTDRTDAIRMLTELSGKTHLVITAVCLCSSEKTDCFDEYTEVTFNKLLQRDIELYVDNFRPFDKAGSYGAQECLPPEKNPCSQDEIDFLKEIGKFELIAKSLTTHKNEVGLSVINQISGSYFNVMGLPIHKLHQHLQAF